MILLWGVCGDPPLAHVRQALDRMGVPVVFVDQREVLQTRISLAVGSDLAGVLRTRRQTVDLSLVTAAYLRPHDVRRLPPVAGAGHGSRARDHALAIEDALWSWAALTPALVVNRPEAMATNNAKPYQAAVIRSFGFETPATLITTDPRAVIDFWRQHRTVIYKSISGVRSIVTRLAPRHLPQLDAVRWCPTQFQQYVPGVDYRVHIVGGDVFASEVISEADDYRYPERQGASVSIRPCDLPAEWADRCRALAATMDLIVAGIDLRCTPEGTWYCFEVNPSPGFTFYQAATGQPIDEAIARLLAESNRLSAEATPTNTPAPGNLQ